MTTRPTLQFLIDLALDAGKLIEAGGKEVKNVTQKASCSDLVTEYDVATERFCVQRIRATFPDHRFHGEEEETEPLTDLPTWVMDPIDGTANFVHTHPDHCISLAYFENQKPLMGAIYVPNRKELYTAELGKGAYLNAHTDNPIKLHVATKRPLAEALVATGFMVGYLHKQMETEELKEKQRKFREVILHNATALIDKANDLRRTGSSAVDCCAVAAGRVDAYAEIGVHTYDYGAGVLIVTEAGGVALGYNEEPFDFHARHIVVASSQELATEISKLLKKAPISEDEF